MQFIDQLLLKVVDFVWGPPLVILLMGGGLFLTLFSRLLPFTGFRHSFNIIRGHFDHQDDPGDISHFQALATALSSTIGMGNIGGVAIAITQGGPGAVFWMWMAALVGMATKFFTCTLAVMYRGTDSLGQVQGGPMYYIEQGLGPRFKPLAVFFAICGTVGCLAMFQTNQIAEALTSSYSVPAWLTGLGCTVLAAIVVLGGVQRIAAVASRLVPSMCVLYLICAVLIVINNAHMIPVVFSQIVHDAFSGTAAGGGLQGIAFITVLRTGVKRAAFSNEAGIGTAPMAHGAAKTTEPVREGLVAMIGPFIDTLIICSLTAFIILVSGQWNTGGEMQGVALTVSAFEAALGPIGRLTLILIITMFGLSTIFGYAYYGRKCFSYLAGAEHGRKYDYFYIIMLFVGSVWSADMVVNLLDTAFALMALPNMIATIILAPKVMAATRKYFDQHVRGQGKAAPPTFKQ